MKLLVFSLPGNEGLCAALADHLEGEAGRLTARRFPDGESYLRFETAVEGREIILCSTLHEPDCKVLPLIFAAATAKELGAARIGLVAPYLAYMRQDKRFNEGEAITSVHFAQLLSRHVDWLVTVDPHLHRRSSLGEIYGVPTRIVHAAPLLAEWIGANIESPLLIGPDSESEQWVSEVARGAGAPWMVLQKIRKGDRDVTVSLPDTAALTGHTPVLVDDIISTARTMIAATRHLKGHGIAPPVCVGVHAVFAADAHADLLAAGAGRIVTADTIPHPSNAIAGHGLIARSVADLLGKPS